MGTLEKAVKKEAGPTQREIGRRRDDLREACKALVRHLRLYGLNSYALVYAGKGYLVAVSLSDQLLILYTLSAWQEDPAASYAEVWEVVWKM